MALPLVAGIAAMVIPVAKAFLAIRITSIIIKVFTRILILGIILAAFYGVLTAVQTATTGLTTSAPNIIQTAYSWFVPSNFSACMSAIITVQLIIWAWHWKQYAYNMMTGGVS